MSFFIESAAAEGAAPAGGDPSSLIIMMVVFAAVFYFMIWRPQAKRTKDHKNLMSALSKGDEVVTNGGIVGKIAKVSDDFIIVTVSEGVDMNFQKAAVASVLPKGTIKSI
ncbi:MAG: preprotein translocase subunit YajC [Gammaproteobacteria bacterium]|jgi:preprotein translocase subunit YajC|nr:preprotein translocase subunit YajC [Gammaproteobacteria bacterium]MCP4879199.1 preprotein translocase subunit YajC [Gammaproteobacteria bacterium]MDP6165889.1 preprotein translocase subunit YajC [Gammaproteobacteria bacterium]